MQGYRPCPLGPGVVSTKVSNIAVTRIRWINEDDVNRTSSSTTPLNCDWLALDQFRWGNHREFGERSLEHEGRNESERNE